MTINRQSRYITLTMSLVAITTAIIAATLYVLIRFLLDEATDIEANDSHNGEVHFYNDLFYRNLPDI